MLTRPTVSDIDLDAGLSPPFPVTRDKTPRPVKPLEYLPEAMDPEPGSDHILRERQAASRTYFFTCGVPAAGAFAHLGAREMNIFRTLS